MAILFLAGFSLPFRGMKLKTRGGDRVCGKGCAGMNKPKYQTESLLFILAVLFRLWHLGRQSLWMDEGFSVWLSSHSLHDMFIILQTDAHPPLFYLFLHYLLVFGRSEEFLRFPFILLSALNSVLVFQLARRSVASGEALLAALFWAISFEALASETQVRMYGMALCFSLLSCLTYLKAFEKPSLGAWAKYLIFTELFVYTHYYAFFMILTQLILLCIRKRWRETIWIAVVLGVLFVPWIPTFSHQFFARFNPRPSINWREILTFSGFVGTYDLFNNRIINGVISFLCLSLVVLGCVRLGRAKRIETQLLILILVISGFLPFSISKWTQLQLYLFRYAILLAPYFLILFFSGLLHLPRSIALPCIVGLLAVNVFTWILYTTAPAFQLQNWRQAAVLLRKGLAPGEPVIIEHFMSLFPLWYYLPDEFVIDYLPNQYMFQIIPQKTNLWIPVNQKTPIHALEQVCRNSKRQWLVLCGEWVEDPSRKIPGWFAEHRHQAQSFFLPSFQPEHNIRIFMYEGGASK